ncbi:MAG: hypothetical protein WCF84_17470 [Anaerolineae bacterium]
MPNHSRDAEGHQANPGQSGSGGDVLGHINSDATPSNPPSTGPQGQSGGDNPLGDILGQMMGGGSAPQTQSGGDPLGGLLGALLGGGSGGQGTSPLGGLLGGLFGGQQGSTGMPGNMGMANSPFAPLLTPLADSLAAKFNLPPNVAEGIVLFAVTKLTESGAAGELTNRVTSGQGVNRQHLMKSGLAGELAQQHGIDEHTAAAALEHVFGGLGDQLHSQ